MPIDQQELMSALASAASTVVSGVVSISDGMKSMDGRAAFAIGLVVAFSIESMLHGLVRVLRTMIIVGLVAAGVIGAGSLLSTSDLLKGHSSGHPQSRAEVPAVE